jgi:acylglycerol lipase
LEDEGGDGSSVRDYSLFTTKRGDTLFSQSWSPLSPNHRGLIVLLHGLNEHSGRYSDFAKQLNANGFKVYGIDWIGK